MAKGALIVAVQVLSCEGSGTSAGVLAGINWALADALQQQQRAVMSMSLGGPQSQAENDAIDVAHARGVVVVVAAGNDAADACQSSPASAPDAVTVGSTTAADQMSSFSSYGPCVDIFAPGSSVRGAWSTSDSATNTISGTSMATPHVAGAAALIRSERPDLSAAGTINVLRCMATADTITGVPSNTLNLFLYAGAATTQPSNLNCLFPPLAPPPPPPVPFPPAGDAGGPIELEITITTDNWPSALSAPAE